MKLNTKRDVKVETFCDVILSEIFFFALFLCIVLYVNSDGELEELKTQERNTLKMINFLLIVSR